MSDEGWGPTVRGGGRRRRPGRWLALLLLVAVAVGAGAAAWTLVRLPRVEVEELAATGSPMHVLVVGSDSREDLTDEQRRALATGAVAGDRTDTIFVMTIDRSRIALLAFPRDLWVERCDGSVGRINAAEDLAGPGCLVRTIRDLSGIEVAHYVRVTFGGFVDLVDAVGGVELCLDEAISDRDAGIDLPAGCQRLDGPDALGYVRVRKIDDDLHRIERQQQFLKALAAEVVSPRTVLDPRQTFGVATEAGDAIGVDDRMGVVSLARLTLGVRALATGAATTYTVPTTPHVTSGGAQVLLPHETEAEALFARFRDGRILDEATPGPDPDAPTPSDVRVVVLNGAGVSGLAAEVAGGLEHHGFTVESIANAERRATSVVRHPPGQDAAARLVADASPGEAMLEESGEVDTVTLILGENAAAP